MGRELKHTATKDLKERPTRKLYLDDYREAPDNSWTVVRSYDEFVDYIQSEGVPDIISFDHDLSLEHYKTYDSSPNLTTIPYNTYKEKTGLDCVKYLIDNELPLKNFFVHSKNPVGAENIRHLCNNWQKECASRNLKPSDEREK